MKVCETCGAVLIRGSIRANETPSDFACRLSCGGACRRIGRKKVMFSPDWWAKKRRISPSGCWEWTGSVNGSGYGLIGIKRDGVKTSIGAHRAAFESYVRPLRPGEFVLHSCDNPTCVNPDHLRAGTPQENMDDKVARGRHYCGSEHHRSKLDDADVLKIRARYDAGEKVFQIRKDYPHVAWINLKKAASRQTWKHLP